MRREKRAKGVFIGISIVPVSQLKAKTYDMLTEILFKASFELEILTATHEKECCAWKERNEQRIHLLVVR